MVGKSNPRNRVERFIHLLYYVLGSLVAISGLIAAYVKFSEVSKHTTNTPPITISAPTQSEAISRNCLVSGSIRDRGKTVVVFVQSLKTKVSYFQGRVSPSDNQWELTITVGEGVFDSDEQWLVWAFAVDPKDSNFNDLTRPPKDAGIARVTISRKN